MTVSNENKPRVASFGERGAALFLALRPKQWAKNLLLFAALLFTLNERHPVADWVRAAVGFGLFCLLSGCAYLINDLRDIDADRQHPRKRLRPLASGRLPIALARAFAVVVAPLCVLGGGFLLGPLFALAAGAYFAETLAYSLHLKNVVLLDVLALSAGFVLRAVAGSAAVRVPPSPWLLLCTFLLALFLGLLKRRAEVVALGEAIAQTRPILAQYPLSYLDQAVTLVATTCLVAYLLYTFLSPTGQAHPYLMATAPFVLYGLFRYLLLAHQGKGEAPELVLLEDRSLQINLVLWTLAVVLAMLLH